MDFRTEWSSWVLVVLMMIIAYFISPFAGNDIVMQLVQTIGLPFVTIAFACIPVLIVCYLIKLIPDIDYSIRLAFIYMVIMFIYQSMR